MDRALLSRMVGNIIMNVKCTMIVVIHSSGLRKKGIRSVGALGVRTRLIEEQKV